MIRLRQTKGADSGREMVLDQDLIRIGRMPDSDVNFDPEVDLDASGRHAEIRSEDGRYLLIDTGSRNGTWLNGQRIKHAALHSGDEIEFGRGGPRLEVVSIESRHSNVRGSHSRPAPPAPRDPRFDPLAVPVTTATRLDELLAESEEVADRLGIPRERRGKKRPRRRSTALLWGAVGVVLLAALVLILRATLE